MRPILSSDVGRELPEDLKELLASSDKDKKKKKRKSKRTSEGKGGEEQNA